MESNPWNPEKPYILDFGRFSGKALEQLPFLPGFRIGGLYRSGYDYLLWLIENHSNSELVRHALWVKNTIDSKIPIVNCTQKGCRSIARHVEKKTDSSGTSFGFSSEHFLFCDRHNEFYISHKWDTAKLEFRNIHDFPHRVEREWFIRILKLAFLGSEDIKITRKVTFNFLSGKPQLSLF